jgi:hypothetical protein
MPQCTPSRTTIKIKYKNVLYKKFMKDNMRDYLWDLGIKKEFFDFIPKEWSTKENNYQIDLGKKYQKIEKETQNVPYVCIGTNL